MSFCPSLVWIGTQPFVFSFWLIGVPGGCSSSEFCPDVAPATAPRVTAFGNGFDGAAGSFTAPRINVSGALSYFVSKGMPPAMG